MIWKCRDISFDLSNAPLVMGIVNITPDSFSDGGLYQSTSAAVAYALGLAEAGADILDLGGESTRPDAEPVSESEELRRVLPVVEGIRKYSRVPLSIDTTKARVAEMCLQAGARIVNDISAMRFDERMPEVVARYHAGLVLMHIRGTPQTMQQNPTYDDVVAEVRRHLEERLQAAVSAGIAREAIAIDPGIGFGKTLDHTLAQLRDLSSLSASGRPVLLGISRKGFLGQVTGRDRAHRLAGTLAVNCFAIANGSAQIVRVHDVAEHVDAVRLWAAIRGTTSL